MNENWNKHNETENASIRYPANTRAKLIAIEGPDGAGKTTVCRDICNRLANPEHPFYGRGIFASQPSTAIGPHVKELAMSGKTSAIEEAVMFAALQTVTWFGTVLGGRQGDFVFTDRYAMSTFCYQNARHLGDPNDIIRIVQNVPHPDLTIVLTPDVETCQKRLDNRGVGNAFDRDAALQRQVHSLYHFAVSAPQRVFGRIAQCVTAEEAIDLALSFMKAADDRDRTQVAPLN